MNRTRQRILAVIVSLTVHVSALSLFAYWGTDVLLKRAQFPGHRQAIELEMRTSQEYWEVAPPPLPFTVTDQGPVVIEPHHAQVAQQHFVETPPRQVPPDEILASAKSSEPSVARRRNSMSREESPQHPELPATPKPLEKRRTARTPSFVSVAKPPGTGDQTPPRFTHNAPPRYPELALQRGWQGVVLLKVSIDRTGSVVDVEVARGSGHAVLDGAAVIAVRRWQGQPAYQGGVAVPIVVDLPVHFELP